MLKITLIAIGEKMPCWVDEATCEYLKRIKKHAQLKSIFIKVSNALTETTTIIKNIPHSSFNCLLDINGETPDSVTLAQKLAKLTLIASHICFIIGGPNGVTQEIAPYIKFNLSLSKLTYSHHLVRVCFLEAIYRSFCINSNHPYHK